MLVGVSACLSSEYHQKGLRQVVKEIVIPIHQCSSPIDKIKDTWTRSVITMTPRKVRVEV